MVVIRSGKLRHQCVVLYPVDRVDSFGDAPEEFTPGEEIIWCAIEPLSGDELLVSAQVHPEATHKITLRYREDVTARHRLKCIDWNPHRLFKLGVPLSTEERLRDLVITAVEVKLTTHGRS